MTTVATHLPTGQIPTYMGEPMRPTPSRTIQPATVELLIPTKPPLPRRLSPRRAPAIGKAWAIGWGLLACGEVTYAVIQILGGAR